MILPKLEAAERLTVAAVPTPGAEELVQGLLTLPTHPRVQPRDLTTIEGILRRHGSGRSRS